jgi:hypothetical protein
VRHRRREDALERLVRASPVGRATVTADRHTSCTTRPIADRLENAYGSEANEETTDSVIIVVETTEVGSRRYPVMCISLFVPRTSLNRDGFTLRTIPPSSFGDVIFYIGTLPPRSALDDWRCSSLDRFVASARSSFTRLYIY